MSITPVLDLPMRDALVAYLLPWADSELVLGHRDSEWTGFAPLIEEDVAFSSIAQDEIGHAALIYGLVAELTGDDPDRLALRRPADAYCHAAVVEQPNGDWAHTVVRHYLYDLADAVRLEALSDSTHGPLAGIARKMAREEHYHRMHGEMWWERLGRGTGESRARLLAAARAICPLVPALFTPAEGQEELRAAGILPRSAPEMLADWRTRVEPILADLDPTLPALLLAEPPTRAPGVVSEDFAALHAEMTMVSASGLGERW